MPAIVAEGIGKSYRISHRGQEVYSALRDVLASKVKSFCRRIVNSREEEADRETTEEFWALRHVNFQVEHGDVVGIIGPNGAGKSTLLKILSRITEPTEGRVVIDGRVACLLEVGTGFHPELTGRENIYLNGAVLGMQRAEISKKFDEIVAFAEVEKFLDTPVKRFSSGMYLRLAFAVAAHLEPEILLVDEVLAVGDAAFQKKCIGKMGDVASCGKTVFFVSHNMGAISKLCRTAIVLSRGQIAFSGEKMAAIEFYQKTLRGAESQERVAERSDRKGNGQVRIEEFDFLDSNLQPSDYVLSCEEQIRIRMRYRAKMDAFAGRFFIVIRDQFDVCPIFFDTAVDGSLPDRFPREGSVNLVVSKDIGLAPGVYHVNLWAFVNGEVADWIVNAATLTITGGDFFGYGKLPSGDPLCLVRHEWRIASTSPTPS